MKRLLTFFKKRDLAPIIKHYPLSWKSGRRTELSAITQNRLLGAHIAQAGDLRAKHTWGRR